MIDEIALQAWCRRANQRPAELSWLLGILKQRELRRVLEIGSQDGGTLWAWSQIATDDAEILSIDWEGNVQLPQRAQQRAGLIVADSRDPATRDQAQAWFTGPVDFLFIDGSHTAEYVVPDWELYSPLVARGGLVAFHDIDSGPSNGVEALWAELKQTYRTDEMIEADWRDMGIGVLYFD